MSFDRVVGLHQPQTDIGLGLRPPTDSLQVRVIDTRLWCSTPYVKTVWSRRAQHRLRPNALPGFSHITAGLLTQLRLSATDINFGVNPVADSMFLQLRYTGDAYGHCFPTPLGQPLSDSLSLDSAYHSNYTVETTGEEWVAEGSGPWTFEPTTDLFVGEDTLAPQLRLPLSLDAAQSILDLDSASFDNNAAWFDVVPGIAIQHDGSGHGIAALDINSGLSVMRLHYHNDSDTAFYDFLDQPSERVNVFATTSRRIWRTSTIPSHRIEWRREVARVGRVGMQNTGHVSHLTSLVDSAANPHHPQGRAHRSCGIEWGMKPATPKTSCSCSWSVRMARLAPPQTKTQPIPIGGEYDAARTPTCST